MTRTLTLVLALGLTTPVLVAAQDQPPPSVPQSLTLEDAIDLARSNNPGYRQVANDRPAADWGVRNAYASFLPRLSVSGGFNYSGPGSQAFLSEEFKQLSGTVGSNYSLDLSMGISGQTLMQPGLARAQRNATEASILGAEISLEAAVRQQYLAVLQAQAQVGLAETQLRRNEEFLRLARARFDVGQNTMLDVRQAEVARGQAQVALLQARQAVMVEKLRLFQQIGVPAPDDPSVVTLPDSFPIVEPTWQLHDLLAEAEERNPNLTSLRAQSVAARAGEKATKSQWLPSLSLSAGWSGFTRQYTNIDPLVNNQIASAQLGAVSDVSQCQFVNQDLLNPGGTPLDCNSLQFTSDQEAAIRAQLAGQNQAFPFHFTGQPFSARIGISLPIFTQFSRPLQVAEASARTEDAEEAARARSLQVRTDVSQAYYTLQTAYETIGIQQANRTAADEQLRLATERYRVGSGTFFELLDAQLASQRAEADYINAVYQYHRSIAALEAAVGRTLR